MKEKFGVTPEQVVDVLALMGDTIDNVKGVPGIGEKGARELIATYGTLDALLERAAEVPQKKYREALLAHEAEARQSRELLQIHTTVPVEFDINAFRYRGPTREACYELFSELGFRSLVMEYAPTADTTATDYQLVTTLEERPQGRGRTDSGRAIRDCGSCPIRPPRCVPASSGSRSRSLHGRRGTCRSGTSMRPLAPVELQPLAEPAPISGLTGNLSTCLKPLRLCPLRLCALRPLLPLRSSTH